MQRQIGDNMKKSITVCFVILCLTAASFGANLANPASQIGEARLAFGAAYHVNGSTITNMEIPMMMNRMGGRMSYSPVKYLSIGADLAAVQISVDQYEDNSDNMVPLFDGKYGVSFGGSINLYSPFLFNNSVAFVAIASGNFFRSENKHGAYYGGNDGAAAAGIHIRVPNFGFISAGPHLYIMNGENKSFDNEKTGAYSNINNVRGWIAFDYFPQVSALNEKTQPYFSVEFTMSPKINTSSRVRVQEFSVAVSMGTISQRLYGVDRNIE